MNGRAPLISPGRAGPGWAARGAPVIYTNYNCDVLKVEIVVPGPESGTRWALTFIIPGPGPGNTTQQAEAGKLCMGHIQYVSLRL